MNKLVLIGALAATALAIGVPIAMTMANNSRGDAQIAGLRSDTDGGSSKVQVASADARAAENRAESAEAKARAAEAKIQCERERQAASNRGAVAGGVLGGVVGVLAGRQVAMTDHRC